MKINRSNRLLRGLLITAAVAPSLAFAQVDPSNPSNNILADDVLLGNVIDDPDNADPLVLIVDPATVVDVQVTGQTLLNGTLTVQPLETTTITPGVAVPGSGVSTTIGGVNPAGTGGPSILNETLIDTTQDSQVVTGGGGATIETNGDTTLTSDTSTTTTVTYGRRVTFETAQAGNMIQPLVGVAIPNTEIYYLTDSAGVVVPGAPTFSAAIEGSAALAQAALDAYIAGLTPGDILTTYPALGTAVTTGGAGGNLEVNGNTTLVGGTEDGITGDSVGGNLEVGGDTVLGDSVNDSTTISGDASVAGNLEVGAIADVEQAIDDNAADIAQEVIDRTADVDAEEAARILDVDAEEAARIVDVDAEEAARILDVDTEEAARIAADVVLQGNIDTEVADRSALIRSEGLNADGNEIVHIGGHSLITQELGGQQLISAQDAGLNAIDIRITGGSNVIVDGTTLLNDTLTVQPAVASTMSTSVTGGAGVPTQIGGVIPGTGGNVAINQTLMDTSQGVQVDTGGGGATIETNGNTTLRSDLTTTSTVNYGRAVTFEVAQAGNVNPLGLAIPGTEVYSLIDVNGVQIPGTPTFASEAALDAYIAGLTPAQILAFDPANGSVNTVDGNGGNLVVYGNTTLGDSPLDTVAISGDTDINGNLELGAIADVEQAINDNAANIAQEVTDRIADVDAEEAARIADVDAEEAARIADVNAEEARALAAEGVLTTNLNSEITNRIADVDAEEAARIADVNAEEAARIADVNAEEARALAAEGVLTNNLATEVTNRTNADTLIRSDFAAADTVERNARIAEDLDIRSDFAAADNAIRNEFAAGDRRLQNQIDSNSHQIDQNTRGIAMVAAMTNTTIQPGMKQAIDFNLAQFEGETGFGFGYGYRVNENLQINAAGASTTDFEESVVRLGLSYQW